MNSAYWLPRFQPALSDIFTSTFSIEARLKGPLTGITVAVKDLYDVAGQITLASQAARRFESPAKTHAVAVDRFVRSGARLVGHTVSTQCAFSGVGQNPDFGEPRALWSPDGEPRLAGGSTRGGALAVAAGLADIALGTDTGGSCRIPAACNGIFGIKLSADAVPMTGCQPLAQSLDSVGVMSAHWHLLERASETLLQQPGITAHGAQRWVVPEFCLKGLEPDVAEYFEWVQEMLRSEGHQVETRRCDFEPLLEAFRAMPPLAALEAYQNYRKGTYAGANDPLVLARLRTGVRHGQQTLEALYQARAALIDQFTAEFADAYVLMPTLPMLPPTLDFLNDPDEFQAMNARLLDFPSVVNAVNGCAVSIPLSSVLPVSVTIAAPSRKDTQLLGVGRLLSAIIDQQTG